MAERDFTSPNFQSLSDEHSGDEECNKHNQPDVDAGADATIDRLTVNFFRVQRFASSTNTGAAYQPRTCDVHSNRNSAILNVTEQ